MPASFPQNSSSKFPPVVFSLIKYGLIVSVLLFGIALIGGGFSDRSNLIYGQGAEGVELDDAGGSGGATQPSGGGTAEPEAPKRESYFMYTVKALGIIFAPIFLILSVCAVAFVIVNFMAIRREVIMPVALVEHFGELLDEKDYQGAYELAKDNDSFIGKVLAAGLAKMSGGYEQASQAMQEVAEKETMIYEQRLGIVALIGNISPMIGLLGTVVGMVASFQVLAYATGPVSAQKLAEGIATALVTTEFGLIIAIPAIVVYDLLRNKLALLILEMSVMTESLMAKIPGVGK